MDDLVTFCAECGTEHDSDTCPTCGSEEIDQLYRPVIDWDGLD